MKKMYIITLIALVGIVAIVYYSKSKKQISVNDGRSAEAGTAQQMAQQRAQIAKLGTAEFVCTGMEDFTFQYTLFPGLSEPKEADPRWDTAKQSCTIFLNARSSSASSPQIKVQVIYYDVFPNFSDPSIQLNPKNVRYKEVAPAGKVKPPVGGFPRQFYGTGFAVKISFLNPDAELNLDPSLFWRAVIDSFEFSAKK